MKTTHALPTIAALISIFSLASCKPTEKNYKTAYDIAVEKRNRQQSDLEIMSGGAKIIRPDEPDKRVIESDTIYLRTLHISAVDPDRSALMPFNVVVGAFKMPANAFGQKEGLSAEGYASRVIAGPEGMYYCVAAGFSDLRDAAAFIKNYKKKYPDINYVGLPSGICIFVPAGLGIKY